MVLRGILKSYPNTIEDIDLARRIVLVGLEGIETIASQVLNYGINNLGIEWELIISPDDFDIHQVQSLIDVLSNLVNGLLKKLINGRISN